MNRIIKPNRRTFLKGVAGATVTLAAPAVWTSGARAQNNVLTVADSGGINSQACTEAFYTPFFEKTGIQVIPVERRDNPLAEVRAMVEAGSHRWDLAESIGQDVATTLADGGYLENLDLSGDTEQIPWGMKSNTFIAENVIAFILAYRTDKYSSPIGLSEFWDAEAYPGRRGLRAFARDTLQMALVADGAAPEDIPTILSDEAGWQRVFAKLDAIKPHVAVWWQSAPQTPTLLQTGEVDMLPTFNPRAQSVIDAGTPVGITWDGAFYNNYGWIIPKGSPKADMAREFIAFCSSPDAQAKAAAITGWGPTNPEAIGLIEPARAAVLPTHPDNFSGMAPIDFAFWGAVQEDATRRFNDWLAL